MSPINRIAATWYTYGYLREAVLIYPVYAIMLGEHGIDAMELSTLFIVWAGSALVFEVPAGVLADRYSRKWLLVISGAIKGTTFIVWWISPDFTGFLLGFVLWGGGSSLVSGTSESFVYDSLAARGEQNAFARVYGRGLAANSLGIATALACGGFLAEGGYDLPIALSIAAPWGSALVAAMFFIEPPRSGAQRRESWRGILANGLSEVRQSRMIMFIVAMFATLVTGYGVVDEYIGPFLKEQPGFTLGTIGIAYACAFAARTVGMEFAHRLPIHSPRGIALLFALGTLGLAASVATNGASLIATISAYFGFSSAAEVLLQTRLQQQISGAARATVTSFARMTEQAVGVCFYLFIGAVAQRVSFETALGAMALLTGAMAIAFAMTARWIIRAPSPRQDASRMSGHN